MSETRPPIPEPEKKALPKEEKTVRFAAIRRRLQEWWNPPNGCNVKISAKGGRKGTIRHVTAMYENAAADLEFLLAELKDLESDEEHDQGELQAIYHALYEGKFPAKGKFPAAAEIAQMFKDRVELLEERGEIRRALYNHAGEVKVGKRESEEALEIRNLRHQRDVLMNAIRAECGKFNFPDEDRPTLHEALLSAEKMRTVAQ